MADYRALDQRAASTAETSCRKSSKGWSSPAASKWPMPLKPAPP